MILDSGVSVPKQKKSVTQTLRIFSFKDYYYPVAIYRITSTYLPGTEQVSTYLGIVELMGRMSSVSLNDCVTDNSVSLRLHDG